MNLKGEITEAAMKQGVRDSEAMILFLTNSYLSRPFCIKELGWAIEFEKPILVVVEKEERFWPWDIERWRTNRCTRDSNNEWVEGWLSRKYEDCPKHIRDFVQYQHENNLMLSFRRRGFEIEALAREIVLRVRRTGYVPWGGTIPLDRALKRAKKRLNPALYVLHDTKSEFVRRMAYDLGMTASGLFKCDCVVTDLSNATDVVILLTKHLLDKDSRSLKEMMIATSKLSPSMLTFVYLNEGDESWDWSLPSKVAIDDPKRKAEFQAAICGREAYIWRGADVPHEHFALIKDIVLKRFMRHFEAEHDDVDSVTESEDEEKVESKESDDDSGDEDESDTESDEEEEESEESSGEESSSSSSEES